MNTTAWSIDPTHSSIGFKVKHMMFTNISGKFNTYEANVVTEADDFSSAQITFTADVASIDTQNEDRDNHLRSADFFDADQFPKLTFKSSSFSKKADGTYELSGDLTIKGETKFVTLPAEFSGLMTDPWGNTKAALIINGSINRKDWGLVWNAALETGGVLVGDKVQFDIEVQLVKN